MQRNILHQRFMPAGSDLDFVRFENARHKTGFEIELLLRRDGHHGRIQGRETYQPHLQTVGPGR